MLSCIDIQSSPEKSHSSHFIITLQARRSAKRPWMRARRLESGSITETFRRFAELIAAIGMAREDELMRDKLARSAEWQIVAVEYRGPAKVRSWTMGSGRGRYRLLELGIGKQKA